MRRATGPDQARANARNESRLARERRRTTLYAPGAGPGCRRALVPMASRGRREITRGRGQVRPSPPPGRWGTPDARARHDDRMPAGRSSGRSFGLFGDDETLIGELLLLPRAAWRAAGTASGQNGGVEPAEGGAVAAGGTGRAHCPTRAKKLVSSCYRGACRWTTEGDHARSSFSGIRIVHVGAVVAAKSPGWGASSREWSPKRPLTPR